jgi:diacylglycerol kinase (ATP)
LHALLSAFRNSLDGLRHALATERAVRQEAALLALGIPAAFVLASGLWVGAALVASLLLVLAVEFLNTAVEKLCDHVTPERHPQIAIVKDLGSAGALCAQALALLVWCCALVERLA